MVAVFAAFAPADIDHHQVHRRRAWPRRRWWTPRSSARCWFRRRCACWVAGTGGRRARWALRRPAGVLARRGRGADPDRRGSPGSRPGVRSPGSGDTTGMLPKRIDFISQPRSMMWWPLSLSPRRHTYLGRGRCRSGSGGRLPGVSKPTDEVDHHVVGLQSHQRPFDGVALGDDLEAELRGVPVRLVVKPTSRASENNATLMRPPFANRTLTRSPIGRLRSS